MGTRAGKELQLVGRRGSRMGSQGQDCCSLGTCWPQCREDLLQAERRISTCRILADPLKAFSAPSPPAWTEASQSYWNLRDGQKPTGWGHVFLPRYTSNAEWMLLLGCLGSMCKPQTFLNPDTVMAALWNCAVVVYHFCNENHFWSINLGTDRIS